MKLEVNVELTELEGPFVEEGLGTQCDQIMLMARNLHYEMNFVPLSKNRLVHVYALKYMLEAFELSYVEAMKDQRNNSY